MKVKPCKFKVHHNSFLSNFCGALQLCRFFCFYGGVRVSILKCCSGIFLIIFSQCVCVPFCSSFNYKNSLNEIYTLLGTLSEHYLSPPIGLFFSCLILQCLLKTEKLLKLISFQELTSFFTLIL